MRLVRCKSSKTGALRVGRPDTRPLKEASSYSETLSRSLSLANSRCTSQQTDCRLVSLDDEDDNDNEQSNLPSAFLGCVRILRPPCNISRIASSALIFRQTATDKQSCRILVLVVFVVVIVIVTPLAFSVTPRDGSIPFSLALPCLLQLNYGT